MRFHTRLQCAAIAGTLVIVATNGVARTPGAPERPLATVQETVDAVIATLIEPGIDTATRKNRVTALISRRFDFEEMARRVLATNWNKANARQQEEFVDKFKALLADRYWEKISDYEDESVEYLSEKLRTETLATVNTVIHTASVDIPVDYKLYKKPDHRWYAYDVVIEQVSLVRNYRASFHKIIHEKGIDGLLEQWDSAF